MANRRMFSKVITNSSSFLMMSQSAQALYFHLGMNADDDGYCEHFMVMRMTDSKPDDLKILQAKGLVYVFDDKVLIIKDWKVNNQIQKDRYTASKYIGVYNLETICIQDVSNLETQVSIGKLSIDKVSIDKDKKNKDVKKSSLTDLEYIAALKSNPAYSHVNIDRELSEMDAWLLTKPRRQKISGDYLDTIMDARCNCTRLTLSQYLLSDQPLP